MEIQMNFSSKDLDKSMNRGIAKAIDELSPFLLRYARNNHRYKDQTGNLTNSTVVRDIKKGLELYATAHYAKYVSQGTRNQQEDTWIEDAINNNKDKILKTYEKHIDKEMRRL